MHSCRTYLWICQWENSDHSSSCWLNRKDAPWVPYIQYWEVLGFKSWSAPNSGFLPMWALWGRRCWLRSLGRCHSRGRSALNSWPPISACLLPGRWGHLYSEPENGIAVSLSLFPFLYLSGCVSLHFKLKQNQFKFFKKKWSKIQALIFRFA